MTSHHCGRVLFLRNGSLSPVHSEGLSKGRSVGREASLAASRLPTTHSGPWFAWAPLPRGGFWSSESRAPSPSLLARTCTRHSLTDEPTCCPEPRRSRSVGSVGSAWRGRALAGGGPAPRRLCAQVCPCLRLTFPGPSARTCRCWRGHCLSRPPGCSAKHLRVFANICDEAPPLPVVFFSTRFH